MSRVAVTLAGQTYQIDVHPNPTDPTRFVAVVDQTEIAVVLPDTDELAQINWMIVGNRPYELEIESNLHWIQSRTGRHHVEVHDLEATVARPLSGDGRVKAPIPGLITRIMVAADETVTVGQPLLILEAMKMGNEIRSPRAGVVKQINVQTGQSVTQNTLLVEIV